MIIDLGGHAVTGRYSPSITMANIGCAWTR